MKSKESNGGTGGTGDSVDWDAYVRTMAAAQGLVLSSERHLEVVAQLERISGMADHVMSFPLDLHVEPAPVFLYK